MKEKTRTILFWFILIQPFLDLYWFYNGKLAEVLPFTLPTIIRILAVFVIFCMFFSQKQNWQKLGQDKWLILYLALLILYSIIHLIHVKNFNSINPNDYNYSTVSEIFYLIRMLLPLMVIFLQKNWISVRSNSDTLSKASADFFHLQLSLPIFLSFRLEATRQARLALIFLNGLLTPISVTLIWPPKASSILPTWYQPYSLCWCLWCFTSCSVVLTGKSSLWT